MTQQIDKYLDFVSNVQIDIYKHNNRFLKVLRENTKIHNVIREMYDKDKTYEETAKEVITNIEQAIRKNIITIN